LRAAPGSACGSNQPALVTWNVRIMLERQRGGITKAGRI
jgi:hypothetical protein